MAAGQVAACSGRLVASASQGFGLHAAFWCQRTSTVRASEGPSHGSSKVSQTSDELFQEDVTGPPKEGVEAKEEQRRRRERKGEKGESLGYSKTEHAEARNAQLKKEPKEGYNENP